MGRTKKELKEQNLSEKQVAGEGAAPEDETLLAACPIWNWQTPARWTRTRLRLIWRQRRLALN